MTVPTASRRRELPRLKVTTSGRPEHGDLRLLAELLVKLDRQPPVKLVSAAAGIEDDPCTEETGVSP